MKICLVLAILGRCIEGRWFSTWKRCVRICISGGQIDDIKSVSTGSVTSYGRCCSGQSWCRLWSCLWSQLWRLLSASVAGRCTWSFASPVSGDFLALPLWQGRHPGVWFWPSIAGCLSITAFSFSCPGNSTPSCFSSLTLARGFLSRYCDSSLAARTNRYLAILAMFQARCLSNCTSFTQSPCLAIVADMMITYKKLVAASNNEMRLLP